MRLALPSRCSTEPADAFVDACVVETSDVAVGVFRCPVRYRSFRDTGPTARCIVVFPRTAVWIRHAGSRPFLADPSVATIYNAAQQYERFAESPDGDRCDWFGVSDALAREIVSALDPRAADANRPFRYEFAATTAEIYLRQRILLRRLLAGDVDRLEMEEAVIDTVASVVAMSYQRRPATASSVGTARHHDLADAARAELLRTIHVNRSVHDVARSVGTSAFHLCRVFRACTGRTMHQYRMELRFRLALEHLEQADRAGNLSAIAYELGFSSHAHFVRAMRAAGNMPPSAMRTLLRASRPDRA
jgi:AraC-like DNA-binding protein